jgi:di/tricarboxylate transporter
VSQPVSRYWKIFFGAARVFAVLLMIAAAIGAIQFIRNPSAAMEPGMRWALVGLFVVLFLLGASMLRAKLSDPP